ncbi:MAG: response regulator [Rhodospirillaceae bacterium]|jgi:two-component system, OmpR family, phosphate regulon response regulator OmpR|nr:response regulator [Rhodospirillaceae bacterium]MBT4690114.1 response regulator [Rhodospirillaceae bacterium]MBT5080679.1 response regulator [Rhodospirillaceae bacterium]MBT5524207.1 response regulator [Rhodospirillaceae bacterium]MBT5881272.1 response regulator [Rhodospirillaceae bacterium]
MSDDAVHILVVDDDDRLRDLLQRYLGEYGFRVSTASSAAEARTALSGLSFDLLVLDLMMPGESGLDLTKDIRRSNSLPILLLTAMGEAEDRITGLEVGADDYLSKPFEPRELVLRIEAILRRGGPKTEELSEISFGACRFDIERGELMRDGEIVRLTSGEMEMLRLFARRPGVTVGRAELLNQSDAGNVRAVDVQITRLRRKIEDDPKEPRHLCTVWGQGYVFWMD